MSTVTTPAGQISRKVAVPAVVGGIMTLIFANKAQITALYPPAGLAIEIAQQLAPLLLPAIGYQTKEWSSVRAIPPFVRP